MNDTKSSTAMACPAPGCQEHTAPPSRSGFSVGDFARKTGWGPIWDTGCGLSSIWLCPKHYAEAKALANQLVKLCGGCEFISLCGLIERKGKS